MEIIQLHRIGRKEDEKSIRNKISVDTEVVDRISGIDLDLLDKSVVDSKSLEV